MKEQAAEKSGYSPLIYAIRSSRECDADNIKMFIEAGADINAADRSGYTPLTMAARIGHDDIVRALINAGADVNGVDKFGRTPLITASKKYFNSDGNYRTIKALIDAGADVNATEIRSWSQCYERIMSIFR